MNGDLERADASNSKAIEIARRIGDIDIDRLRPDEGFASLLRRIRLDTPDMNHNRAAAENL